MTSCPTCLDIELCDDCEQHACPLCCPNEECPNSFLGEAGDEYDCREEA